MNTVPCPGCCELSHRPFPVATLEGSNSMLHFQRTGAHAQTTCGINQLPTTESALVLSLCWCLVQGSISAIQIHFRLQNINSLISPSIIQLGICQTNCTLYPKYATAAAIQSKIKCGCDADRKEECERGWKTN